ncbi:hypothetical protein D3C81_1407890 [compost metagenome]
MVTHQVRTGRDCHQLTIFQRQRIGAAKIALRIVLLVRDVIERGTIRHPEFMGKTFPRRMLAHLAKMAAVGIDEPHAGVDGIARSFMAKRDCAVVKRTIDRMPKPAFFLQNHLLLAGV